MMTEETKKKIVDTVLAHYPAVQCIYLYGSANRGTSRPDSDIDIALLLPPELARQEGSMAMSDCQFELSEMLRRDVDLVNLREGSTLLQKEVIQCGVLFCGDRYAQEQFEMLTLSNYQKLNEERADALAVFRETGRAYNV